MASENLELNTLNKCLDRLLNDSASEREYMEAVRAYFRFGPELPATAYRRYVEEGGEGLPPNLRCYGESEMAMREATYADGARTDMMLARIKAKVRGR